MTTDAGDAMTTTTTTYADAVRRALDDLPAARYLELVDGLDEHLAEVQADGGASLADVLGPPDAYAADLRASAGLPPRGAGAGAPLPPPVASTRRARPAIDRGGVARVALVVIAVVLAWWMLSAKQIPTVALALLVAGVLGATWLVRRLLRAAALGEVAHRRASVGVTVGGLVVAACLGSMANGRSPSNVVGYPPGVTTFATVPYQPITLPDFRGMTVADAQRTAAQIGIPLELRPSGPEGAIVLDQSPPPDMNVGPGQVVTLLVGAGPMTEAPPFAITTTIALPPTTSPTVAATTTPAGG